MSLNPERLKAKLCSEVTGQKLPNGISFYVCLNDEKNCPFMGGKLL